MGEVPDPDRLALPLCSRESRVAVTVRRSSGDSGWSRFFDYETRVFHNTFTRHLIGLWKREHKTLLASSEGVYYNVNEY